MKTSARLPGAWLLACSLSTVGPAATARAQTADADRVAEHKKTILGRMKREPATFRGDKPGEIRVKWEWYGQVVRNYLYEKQALLTEIEGGEQYEVRPRWVYKDMKVTFEELFQLGAGNDDKLIPILASDALLDLAPRTSLEGLTLLGKQGEVKGTIARKYMEKGLYGTTWTKLDYRDKDGKTQTAGGLSLDAVTLRWKDVKDRVADDMSEAKAREDLELTRDALFPEAAGR